MEEENRRGVMRLHWFWSTNPQKVRLALEELGEPYELVVVDLREKSQRTEKFGVLSPRGKVPVLQVGELILWESNAILTWLGLNKGLWPEDPRHQCDAISLLHMESAAFQDAAGTCYFERFIQPTYMGTKPDEARVKRVHARLRPLLDILEERLALNPWLAGPELSVVDCAFAPWFPFLDYEEHPRLIAWSSAMEQRPSWASCSMRY